MAPLISWSSSSTFSQHCDSKMNWYSLHPKSPDATFAENSNRFGLKKYHVRGFWCNRSFCCYFTYSARDGSVVQAVNNFGRIKSIALVAEATNTSIICVVTATIISHRLLPYETMIREVPCRVHLIYSDSKCVSAASPTPSKRRDPQLTCNCAQNVPGMAAKAPLGKNDE